MTLCARTRCVPAGPKKLMKKELPAYTSLLVAMLGANTCSYHLSVISWFYGGSFPRCGAGDAHPRVRHAAMGAIALFAEAFAGETKGYPKM